MVLKLCVLIILLTNVCTLATHQSVPKAKVGGNARMVGGRRALGQMFPYVVAVIITENDKDAPLRCTGSLITLSWVITAAHCYRDVDTDQEQGTRIVAGSVLVNRHENTTQVRYCNRYIVHEPAGDRGSFDMDVALVGVRDPFDLTAHVSTITIAKRPFPNNIGLKCYSIGFGQTDDNDKERNSYLNYVMVIAGYNEYCNQLKGRLRAKEECVCITPVKEDTCAGDSGGPLVCQGLLAGTLAGTAWVKVVNGATSCLDRTGVTIDMFTGYFESWIRKYVPDLPESQLLSGGQPLPPPLPTEPEPDENVFDEKDIEEQSTLKHKLTLTENKNDSLKYDRSASQMPERGESSQAPSKSASHIALNNISIVIMSGVLYLLLI